MTPNKPTDVYVIVYQKRRLGTTAETFTKGQLNKTSLIFITCLVKTEQCWNISSQYWAVQWSWFAWVNALCNLSHKKSQEVAASLLGWFLSRHCFTLCITTEAEPRIAKQDKCHHCWSCKSYQGKGMEGGKKKCLGIVFRLTKRLRVHGKNAFWGTLLHEQQVIACCQTHSDYGPTKMSLKLAV